MPSIVAYRQVTDAYTTHRLLTPEGCSELATIDGLTFVSVPDGAVLSTEQPAAIAASISTVTSPLLLQALLENSSHAQLIIARRAARIAGGESVAAANTWAAAQMGALGLVAEFSPGWLAHVKALRVERNRAECSARIYARYPPGRQSSAALGLYDATSVGAMQDWIGSMILAENNAADAIDAAATISAVEAVTVAWPA